MEKNHFELSGGEIQKLNGCKLDVTAGNYQEGVLIQWLEASGIDAQVIPYSGYGERMPAMDAGEIDALL